MSLTTKESQFFLSSVADNVVQTLTRTWSLGPACYHVFFHIASSLRTPAAIPHLKHSLPLILASFSKPSVLHSPLHFPEIQSPPFHLHIHQSQHLLGGNTVCYSPSLSNLSSSLSYDHAYRVSSTSTALPTNPCSSFPFIYLKNSLLLLFGQYLCVVLTVGSYMDRPSGGGSWAVIQ